MFHKKSNMLLIFARIIISLGCVEPASNNTSFDKGIVTDKNTIVSQLSVSETPDFSPDI